MVLTIISFILLALLLLSYLLVRYFNGPKTPLAHSMKGKTVIIPGGDSSIGFETALELLEKGAKVIFACRDQKKTTMKLDTIKDIEMKKRAIYIHLDLLSYDSIVKFVTDIKEKVGKIDILLNNAGTCFQQFSLVNGIEKTLFTNHVGHVILTSLLLDSFNPQGRIITVTTTKYKRIRQYELDQFTSSSNTDFSMISHHYDWMRVYVMSKLSNILHMVYLSDYITRKNLDIKAVAIHPGFVQNDFFREIHSLYWTFRQTVMIPIRRWGFKDTKMGAQTHLHLCYMDYNEMINGGYYKDCHYEQMKPIAKLDNAKKLIAFTKEIILKNDIVKNNQKVLDFFK